MDKPTNQPKPKNHKRLIIIIAAGLVVLAGASWIILSRTSDNNKKTGSNQAESQENERQEYLEEGKYDATVSFTKKGLEPVTLHVKPNTRVIWSINDNKPHRIVSNPGTKQTMYYDALKNQTPNTNYLVRFTEEGTYYYHDALNPKVNGVIIVDNK